MYEKLKTEEEKKIRYVDKRKLKNRKEQTERYPITRRLDCNKCGAPNWSKQSECPPRGKKCIKCGKLRQYAKCCRSAKKKTTSQTKKHTVQTKMTVYQTKSTQFNKRYTQWERKARTEFRSLLKRYWLIIDQKNLSSTQAHL